MISIKHNNTTKIQAAINSNKNMLIIGAADTDYMTNQVSYYNSEVAVKSMYGEESELTKAFLIAKEAGVPDIFLCNTSIMTDYIELVDVTKQYDFTYIIPLGIKFSDSFYNPLVERQMTYTELFLESMNVTKSLIIMTDYHASLYEDIDSFLNDMCSKIDSFKNIAYKALMNGRNLCFAANNIKDQAFANLMLGIALCTTEFKEYPTYNFGEPVFDIDDFDVGEYDLVFFKKNTNIVTSVENLKNFRMEKDAAKLINIDRVIKFIERGLDFSDFHGKICTEYVRLRIEKTLSEFLSSIKGEAILDYSVNSIDFKITQPGAGAIINQFTINPLNSIEEIDISMEV